MYNSTRKNNSTSKQIFRYEMCFLSELFFLVELFFSCWLLHEAIWGPYWRLDCKWKISFSEATTYFIQFFSTCIGCCVCWAKKKLQSKLPSNIFLRNSQHVLSTYTVHLLHSSCTFSQNSHWDRYFRKSAKSIPKRRLLFHTQKFQFR